MAGPGNIIISVGAETAKAVAELAHVNKALDDTATSGDRMKAGLKAAALPAAAALGVLGAAAVSATKAAMEDQAVHEHLVTSLKNTTSATQAQIDAVSAYIDKTELATGVTDDQLSPAFESLARATGNTTDAQKLMGIALDVSAASGKDLETVANAMAKAHEGQTAQLAKLVPGLSEAARSSKDFDVILGELADTTGGAMANAADTASGRMARFKASTDQLQETLGYALLPILQAILPLLQKVALFAQDNAKVIEILAGIIATLSAGILVANAALKAYEAIQIAVKVATAAWTAAQWLLNAALNANPIGLVTVAIAALAAGLIYAYKHSETFRDIVQAAFRGVLAAVDALKAGFSALMDGARAAFDWVTSHWQVAVVGVLFGPIGVAVLELVKHFGAVKDAAADAFNFLLSIVSSVERAISGVIGAVESLISALGRIHVPDIHLPHIPGVTSAGLVYAGSAGGVAAFGSGAPAGVYRSSSGAGVTVNVYGAIDPEGTARTVRRVLDQHDRRMGRRAT